MEIQKLLQDLNNDFFLSKDPSEIEEWVVNGMIDKEAIENKWLGYAPASYQDIHTKEKQLDVILPRSYKNFLLTSNGFKSISTFLNNLFPIEKVEWAKNVEEQWWLDMLKNNPLDASDKDYFDYSDEQDSALCRDRYILQSLKVSDWYDGMCIFLNPIVKHDDEWEVLEYATWSPGIQRYRTFNEFLAKTHESNVRLLNHKRTNNPS